MMQVAQRHPNGFRPRHTRYYSAFIYRVCLILLPAVALAGGWLSVNRQPSSGPQPADSPLVHVEPQTATEKIAGPAVTAEQPAGIDVRGEQNNSKWTASH